VASYEVPFPDLDLVLPEFIPGDHDLTLPPAITVMSHFQDIGPTQEDPPPLDLLSLGLAPPLASIFTSIQHISQLVPTFSAYPTASSSRVILTRMCTILSHLLSLPPQATLSANSNSSANQVSVHISESARYAILLHVFSPWRGLPPDGTLTINYLMHRLISSLKALLLTPNYSHNIFVLWMFSAGGVSALNMPERAWFVGHLVEMTEEMGINTWEEMKACVSRGIWHERLTGHSYRKVWDEIEEKKSAFAT
jgi:Fungal specific transcription factor domain